MSIFTVNESQLNSAIMPPSLRDFLTDAQWYALHSAYKNAADYSTGVVCMVEWGICLFFCFPCVFCCHGCLVESVVRQELEKSVRSLNTIHFYSSPVFTVVGSSVAINTNLISSNEGNHPVAANAGIAYATAQPMPTGAAPYVVYSDPAANPPKAPESTTYNNVVATPVAPTAPVAPPVQQSLTITVPRNATPGQTLAVTVPDGRVLHITLGSNVAPGSQLTIMC